MSKLGKKLISAATPDYREIELPISIKALQDYMEPLLYQAGYVKGNEEIIKLESRDSPDVIWISIRIKKRRPVEIIEHN